MANMGYCRFRNTLRDLQDCHEALCDEAELSKEEAAAKERLIELCGTIHQEFGD